MNKITEVMWISTMKGTMGIVLSNNGFENKAYIKQVSGFDEEIDTKEILETGAKIHLHQAESIVRHLKA